MIRAAEVLGALAPLHARAGRHGMQVPTYTGCFVVPASGNGGCLFTSLRLAVEIETAMAYANAVLDGGAPAGPLPELLLDGFHKSIVAEANYVRKCIVQWYVGENQHKEVPSMGAFEHGGRAWTRSDILHMELVRRGAAGLPEDEGARLALRTAYLNDMLTHSTWGSVPEWTAFALIRKTPTVAYEWDGTGLRRVDVAFGPLEQDEALVAAPWPPPQPPRFGSPAFAPPGSMPLDDLEAYASEPEPEPEAESEAADASSMSSEEGDEGSDAGEEPVAEPAAEPAAEWRRVTRLLFSGKHYDCLMTAREYYTLRAVFGPEAMKCAVPLPQYAAGRGMLGGGRR